MPPLSPSTPSLELVSYHDSELRRSIMLGLLDLLHVVVRRDVIDNSVDVPRWAVFLMAGLPIVTVSLGVAVYYLYRDRRSGMASIETGFELQNIRRRDLESQSPRHPTPVPREAERYWPSVFPGSPRSSITVFPGVGAPCEPQQPRTVFDKSLPELPRYSIIGDAEDWETIAPTIAPMTRDTTFGDAFAQHRADQENERREKERRDQERREGNERSLLEALERTSDRERRQYRGNPYELSPYPSDDDAASSKAGRGADDKTKKPSSPLVEMDHHVNDGYALYRRYRLKYGDNDNDTEIILASDSNTLGPPTTVASSTNGLAGNGTDNGKSDGSASSKNPFIKSGGAKTLRSIRDRRRQELVLGVGTHGDTERLIPNGSENSFLRPPEPARLRGRRMFVAPADSSSAQFPSDQSEMDNFTEAMISDDPYVNSSAGQRYKK